MKRQLNGCVICEEANNKPTLNLQELYTPARVFSQQPIA